MLQDVSEFLVGPGHIADFYMDTCAVGARIFDTEHSNTVQLTSVGSTVKLPASDARKVTMD